MSIKVETVRYIEGTTVDGRQFKLIIGYPRWSTLGSGPEDISGHFLTKSGQKVAVPIVRKVFDKKFGWMRDDGTRGVRVEDLLPKEIVEALDIECARKLSLEELADTTGGRQ
jgi:hypothetical protein